MEGVSSQRSYEGPSSGEPRSGGGGGSEAGRQVPAGDGGGGGVGSAAGLAAEVLREFAGEWNGGGDGGVPGCYSRFLLLPGAQAVGGADRGRGRFHPQADPQEACRHARFDLTVALIERACCDERKLWVEKRQEYLP